MKHKNILKIALFLLGLGSSTIFGQGSINFDTASNWVQAGATPFTTYSTHGYSDGIFSAVGSSVLRNTTATQDGFTGANGTYSFRLRDNSSSSLTMTIASGGVGNFSFAVRRWDGSPATNFTVEYSTDGGTNWIFSSTINAELTTDSDWKTVNGKVYSSNSNIQIRIKSNGTTERIMVDDFAWTGCTTWTGNINSNWETVENWSDGVPSTTISFVIPTGLTNYPVASGAVSVVSGIMYSGASLIAQDAFTGNVTYNRNLGTENWYLVSSPVAGETYDNAYVAANSLAINGANNAIATYLSASNTWSYMETNGGSTFATGTGYSVRRANASGAGNLSFTGTINTSNVSVAVSNAGTGFNLLGNPFTSFIHSETFLTDNTGSLVTTDIWVYNQNSGSYEVKNLASAFVLAPAQGFFVRANAATNLNILESYQRTTGNAFQKSARPEIQISMTDGTNNRFAKIYYLDNATTGYDNGYDGETFGGIANTTDVFTHLVANSQGKKYQIQSLPNADFETMVIPVGIISAAGKEITFSAEAMNLPEGLKVFLEDRLTNSITRLDESNTSYKVTLTESLNGIGRFYLHTKASGVLSTTDVTLQNVSVYSTGKNTLRVVGLSEGKASLKLFNILGKQVFASSFNANGVQDLNLPTLSTGIYVVQLETESGRLNKKITLE